MAISYKNKVLDKLMSAEDKLKGTLISAAKTLETQVTTSADNTVRETGSSISSLQQVENTMKPQIEKMIKSSYPANVLPHISSTQISQLNSIMKTALDSSASMSQKCAGDITTTVNKICDSKNLNDTPSIPATISDDMTKVTKALQDTKQTVREQSKSVIRGSLSQTKATISSKKSNITSAISETTDNMRDKINDITGSVNSDYSNIVSNMNSSMSTLKFRPPASFKSDLVSAAESAKSTMTAAISSSINPAADALDAFGSSFSSAADSAISDIDAAMSEVVPVCHIVLGSDGFDYICLKSHLSTVDDQPITGPNYTTYWYPKLTTSASPWQGDQNYETVIVKIEGVEPEIDYLLKEAHEPSLDNKPGEGPDWETYWIQLPFLADPEEVGVWSL